MDKCNGYQTGYQTGEHELKQGNEGHSHIILPSQ